MKLCASNQVRRIGESDASSTIVEYASISLEQNLLGLSSLLERFQAILAYYPAPSISQSRKILQWVLSRLVCGRPHIFQIPNRHRHFPRGSIDSMNTKSYVHMWPFTGLSVIMRKESESGLINSLWHTTYSIFRIPRFLACLCCPPLFKLPSHLRHQPYIDSLPDSSELLTPLHFTPAELALLNGTNLLGATLDRRQEWETEWREVRDIFADAVIPWGEGLTWYVSNAHIHRNCAIRHNQICSGTVI